MREMLTVCEDFDLTVTHLKHYALLTYSKVIHTYLFHYNRTEHNLQNPYGVVLMLLQSTDRNSLMYSKIAQVFEVYRRVPVLSGLDKKVKKFLRIESPKSLDPVKKSMAKNKKKFIQNKIKNFIEMAKNKRTSFLSVVQKMMNRMRRNADFWSGAAPKINESRLETLESDLDRKITEIQKKISLRKDSTQRQREIDQQRLEVLRGMKQKQEMEHGFRRQLEATLMRRLTRTHTQ